MGQHAHCVSGTVPWLGGERPVRLCLKPAYSVAVRPSESHSSLSASAASSVKWGVENHTGLLGLLICSFNKHLSDCCVTFSRLL